MKSEGSEIVEGSAKLLVADATEHSNVADTADEENQRNDSIEAHEQHFPESAEEGASTAQGANATAPSILESTARRIDEKVRG